MDRRSFLKASATVGCAVLPTATADASKTAKENKGGVGVLVDTLVVRTLVVPALFSVIGDAMWWPRRFAGTPGSGHGADGEESEDAGHVSLPGAG